MKKSKLKVFFIIIVFLLLAIFSNRTYNNIGQPGFIVPVILVTLLIGIIGVYLFGKDKKVYKSLYFISYVIAVGFAFVPVLGVYIEAGNHFYGFPAQWFGYYSPSGDVNFHLMGFLFDYLIIYFILLLLTKTFLRFSKHDGNLNSA